ncbi:Ribose 1,5-bisphosphate isomerase [uncultured archaeon]|nr:Ribose 1,5-bisphosphate isomerase [uncultured archaeon]
MGNHKGDKAILNASIEALKEEINSFKGEKISFIEELKKASRYLSSSSEDKSLKNSLRSFVYLVYLKKDEPLKELKGISLEYLDDLEKYSNNLKDRIALNSSALLLNHKNFLINGFSSTVLRSLKLAQKLGSDLKVYVYEDDYGFGEKTASELGKNEIDTTLVKPSVIPSIAKYRMEKGIVITSPETILRNGDVIGYQGTNLLAMCAKQNKLLVYGITPLYKHVQYSWEPEIALVHEQKHENYTNLYSKLELVENSSFNAFITDEGLVKPYDMSKHSEVE